MKRKRSNGDKSAADLMSEINADPASTARASLREHVLSENARAYRRAAEPLLRELAANGCVLQTLSELRSRRDEYTRVVPILVRWLPIIGNVHVKEDLIRTLSVPWAAPWAAPALITEFKRAAGSEKEDLRWAIANALSVVADDSVYEQLAELVADKSYGKAREMITIAMGNCSDPRAIDALTELLADEQVVGHAVMSLGKLRAQSAYSHISSLKDHPKRWIRREVSKALARLEPIPKPRIRW